MAQGCLHNPEIYGDPTHPTMVPRDSSRSQAEPQSGWALNGQRDGERPWARRGRGGGGGGRGGGRGGPGGGGHSWACLRRQRVWVCRTERWECAQ